MSKYKYALINLGIWEDTPTHVCVKEEKKGEPAKCAICGKLM